MKRLLIATAIAASGLMTSAGMSSGTVLRDGNSFMVKTGLETIVLTPVSNDIIRVATLPLSTSQAILPESQSAILPVQKVNTTTLLTPSEFTLLTPGIIAKVNRTSGNITFFDRKGNRLLSESGGIDN